MSGSRVPSAHTSPSSRWLPRLLALLLVVALGVGGVSAALGDSPAEPIPLGETAGAGPWQMRVAQVLTGQEATDLISAASPANGTPISGSTYIAVELEVTNTSDQPHLLDSGDFVLLGDGWLRRNLGLIAPDPAIDTTVEPGASYTGWVPLGGPDDGSPYVLQYDSLTLSGDWADAAFALTEAGGLPDVPASSAPNDVGTDIGAPAAIGEVVATDGWEVEVLDVVQGDAVYELYPENDRRTTALGRAQAEDPNDGDGDGAIGWLAVRVRVTNTAGGSAPRFLPPDAFQLAQSDGSSLPNGLTLTPPNPDAGGWYAPGETREGWVTFEVLVEWDSDEMRFLPYRTDGDPRYFTIV